MNACQAVFSVVCASVLLIGCGSSPYQSEKWVTDTELRQKHLDELLSTAAAHEPSSLDPAKDLVLLRSDSVAPLAAVSVTGELQSIADELSNSWMGKPCNCQVRVGPQFGFGGFTYPNGTIVIQAGTLEHLDTQDELAALLAHELAHLWLDHHDKNELQSAAKGVADFAQAVAMLGNDAKARETTLRMGGSTDALVAAAGFTQWNRTQETEADLLAAKILEKSRYSPMAMIALLTKLNKGQGEASVDASAYDEMAKATAKKLKKEDTEISDNQVQKWLSTVSSDLAGGDYLSPQERRQIVRAVIYGLEGATLARSFSSLELDLDELSPVITLKSIHELESTPTSYQALIDRALASEPENLHLLLISFRGLIVRGAHPQATKLAEAFIRRPDTTFSALSAATQYLDQYNVLAAEQRKMLMHMAVAKLVELDLPDAYAADKYYLSTRYEVPVHGVLNEKLCIARTGKVKVRERCELAKKALEADSSFYQALARAGL
ncbi:M48 family metalloprotease [Marinobacter salicampi]|uniref:M48 family metalloprotease n=1 Tax=Marinobacter salicampi TaxID=435907 RepID=UPI001407AC13|nr:M48 family metalloprotease [Marinobacter salicampi]